MATPFDILPAIDLRGGRVVRLRKGDFARETAYRTEPAAVAAEFAAAGARWLHVVDLDGARTGIPAHADAIREIVTRVGERVAVEVAGGLRDEAAVAAALGSGAARAIVGTAALTDPAFAGRLVDAHGSARIVVAIDVRDGQAVGHGWTVDALGVDAAGAVGRLADAGISIFEATAIDRDGLLEGPEVALYERLVRLDRGAIIASGGIRSVDDIRAVREVGCAGAIVGRALYEGRLDLAEALKLGPRGPGCEPSG
jgi:phosphoribosylformimino-5-aminoimidazole carboxamide ribotide isomerase